MNSNFLIFKSLLERDLKVTFVNFSSIIIDAAINITCFILIFAYFLPAMGMSKELSAPLFLGTNIITIISISYTRMVRIKSDMEFKHFIKYHFTLPISKKWLLAEYILAFIIDVTISVLPALVVGLFIIDSSLLYKINPLYFCLMYVLSLFFIATSFLFIAFTFRFMWLINNTWEKILTPLIQLGCLLFVWERLNNFSKPLSKLVLLNPVTYIIEGLRTSVFGTGPYLPISLCILILSIASAVMLVLMWKAMKKQMDPV